MARSSLRQLLFHALVWNAVIYNVQAVTKHRNFQDITEESQHVHFIPGPVGGMAAFPMIPPTYQHIDVLQFAVEADNPLRVSVADHSLQEQINAAQVHRDFATGSEDDYFSMTNPLTGPMSDASLAPLAVDAASVGQCLSLSSAPDRSAYWSAFFDNNLARTKKQIILRVSGKGSNKIMHDLLTAQTNVHDTVFSLEVLARQQSATTACPSMGTVLEKSFGAFETQNDCLQGNCP